VQGSSTSLDAAPSQFGCSRGGWLPDVYARVHVHVNWMDMEALESYALYARRLISSHFGDSDVNTFLINLLG